MCEPRDTGVRRRARASERRDGKRRGFDCTRSGGECAERAAADEFALVKTLKGGLDGAMGYVRARHTCGRFWVKALGLLPKRSLP